MVENDRQKIHTFGRGAATAHRVHDLATRSVVIGASNSAERRQRGKLYVYDEYLKILNEGTEPL